MTLGDTSVEYYLADNTALNIIPSGVLSGDWHPAVHVVPDSDGRVELAFAGDGDSAVYNNNTIFGDFGIYDCSETLQAMGYGELKDTNVYASNHIRTLLDQFVHYCLNNGAPVNMLDIEGLLDIESLNRLKAAAIRFLDSAQKERAAYGEFIRLIDDAFES